MINPIDLIFDLVYLFFWLVDNLWIYGAIALFGYGLFHVITKTPTDEPYVSPWQRESLDFDNMPGERDDDVDQNLNW